MNIMKFYKKPTSILDPTMSTTQTSSAVSPTSTWTDAWEGKPGNIKQYR